MTVISFFVLTLFVIVILLGCIFAYQYHVVVELMEKEEREKESKDDSK